MYNETNRQLEKCTEIIVLVMAKVSPVCWILPKVVVSLFLYFTTEVGNDALELPLQIWYMKKKIDLIAEVNPIKKNYMLITVFILHYFQGYRLK